MCIDKIIRDLIFLKISDKKVGIRFLIVKKDVFLDLITLIKNTMKKFLFLLFCFFAIIYIPAQDYYSELRKKYWEYPENDEKAFTILNLYISSAKKEKNYPELYQAYKGAVRYSKNEKLKYADSAIVAAKLSNDNSLIGNAYTGKGIVYYFNYKKFQSALDEYLKAEEYLKKSDDLFLKYQNLYHIGVVKSYLGYYNEALEIFKQCISYFEPNTKADIHPNLIFNNKKGYFNSLHQMSNCYQALGNFKQADKLINNDFSIVLKQDDFFQERSYFYKVRGINEFSTKSYQKAINDFDLSVPELLKINDFTWSSVVYFYRGLSYAKFGNEKKALADYKRVDYIFNKHNFILPEIRRNYEELIDYYKRNKDGKQELYYTKQLLKADSSIANDFKYLSTRIHKDYDTKTLLEAKSDLEKVNYFGKHLLLISMLIIFALAFIVFYWLRRKKALQKKYDELLLKIQNNIESEKKDNIPLEVAIQKDSKLDEKVIESLKKGFAEFEKKKGFLEKGITSNRLSADFGTNTTYLSQFLKEYKGSNFNTYINKLRIDYATEKICNDKTWRKYKVDNIALDCGFSNRQIFSNAFYGQNGIRPADFLRKRKEEVKLQKVS